MTALEILDNIRGPIINLPDRIREIINAYVSMNRVAAYLKISTEKKCNISKNQDKDSMCRARQTDTSSCPAQRPSCPRGKLLIVG